MTEWFLVGSGLVLLVIGGEALVRGAAALARRVGVSPLIVGLTLVGFGTSMPEMATSVEAALKGAPDIAIGNVVGSNIANILLILAIASLIRPLWCARAAVMRDGSVALAATGLAVLLAVYGAVPRPAGAVLVVLLAVYVIVTYRLERRSGGAGAALHRDEAEFIAVVPGSIWVPVCLSIGGIAAVILGAALLVDGAVIIARNAGISEAVIGLTLVAVGTSLPELAVTAVAAARREADVAFGNILGSNIFNLLGILGVTALVEPLTVPLQVAFFDIWVMMAATVVMFAFALSGLRIVRWEGGLLLGAYAAYLWVQFSPAPRAAMGLPAM